MSSLDIAQPPEVAAGLTSPCRRGPAPVSGVFPVGEGLHRWRLDFRQSSFRHITRAPRPLVPYAWAREPVQWHAIAPFVFRVQVSHWTQGYHLHSLPTPWGICQGASWRSERALHRRSSDPRWPRPCVGDPQGRGEASVAVRAGQPLSREIKFLGVPTLSGQVEGHISDGAIASRQGPRAARDPVYVRNLNAREPGVLMVARLVDRGRAAQGMLWMHGHGKSYHLVVPTNRSNKASAAEAGEGRR